MTNEPCPLSASELAAEEAESASLKMMSAKAGKEAAQKPKVVVTLYMTSPHYKVPDFWDRREMDELPPVGAVFEIARNRDDDAIKLIVRANSSEKPNLGRVLGDRGAWIICQQLT